MRKKELIFLSLAGVLVIVFIVVGSQGFLRQRRLLPGSGKVLTRGSVSLAVAKGQVNIPVSIDLYTLLEEHSNALELKRDPFSAAAIISEKTLHPAISLTGILWDKENPLAIINGQVVKKGQRVDSKTIMEIRQDRVILSDGQLLSELRLEN